MEGMIADQQLHANVRGRPSYTEPSTRLSWRFVQEMYMGRIKLDCKRVLAQTEVSVEGLKDVRMARRNKLRIMLRDVCVLSRRNVSRIPDNGDRFCLPFFRERA